MITFHLMIIEYLPPSLILSTVLALLWATVWYVWRGGSWRDWLLDVLAALIGFGVGQLLGWWLDLPLPAIGQVRAVEGTLFSWLLLFLLRRKRSDVS